MNGQETQRSTAYQNERHLFLHLSTGQGSLRMNFMSVCVNREMVGPGEQSEGDVGESPQTWENHPPSMFLSSTRIPSCTMYSSSCTGHFLCRLHLLFSSHFFQAHLLPQQHQGHLRGGRHGVQDSDSQLPCTRDKPPSGNL